MRNAVSVPVATSAGSVAGPRNLNLGMPHTRPRDTGVTEELLARARTLDGDERQAIYNKVIADHLDLAVRLAARYRGRGESQDDLLQVANMGLVMAVIRFDPSRGVKLVDYATPTIVGELRKHFRDHCWTVRPPRRLQEQRPALREAERDLEQLLGRPATRSELAEAMGMTIAEIDEIDRAATGYNPQSLDQPTLGSGQAASATLGDLLPDENCDISTLLDRMTVHTLLSSLSPRQRKVVELRYFSDMTQQQIADEIGVSQVQVSRILSSVLRELRRLLDLEGVLSPA